MREVPLIPPSSFTILCAPAPRVSLTPPCTFHGDVSGDKLHGACPLSDFTDTVKAPYNTTSGRDNVKSLSL
jgi:hypothetical protein